MVNFPLFTGFYTSQVVQDFFHQQYHHQKSDNTNTSNNNDNSNIYNSLTNIERTIVLMYGVYYTCFFDIEKNHERNSVSIQNGHFFTKKTTVLLVPLSYSGDVHLGETDPIFEGFVAEILNFQLSVLIEWRSWKPEIKSVWNGWSFSLPHRIHGWYIFTYIYHKN